MVFIWYDRGQREIERINAGGEGSQSPQERVEAIARVKASQASSPEHLPNHQAERALKAYEEVQSVETSKVLARDIMSAPVETLLETASLKDTWSLIENRQFRHVPVVSESGSLQGIISDRDVLRFFLEQRDDGLLLKDCMTYRVLTVLPETDLRTLVQTMLERKIGSLPVMSADDSPLGIITRSDVLRAIVEHVQFDSWL